MIPAKFASPCLRVSLVNPIVQDHLSHYHSILVTAPPGYFYTDGLAHSLTNQSGNIFWLRLGEAERDPGTLLLSLIEGSHLLYKDLGTYTLKAMVASPGTVFGWSALFRSLGDEMNANHIEQKELCLYLENWNCIHPQFANRLLAGTHQRLIKLFEVRSSRVTVYNLRPWIVEKSEGFELMGYFELRLGDLCDQEIQQQS